MLCNLHPQRIAIGTCSQCGAGICFACQQHIIQGRSLCPPCAESTKITVVPASSHHRTILTALLWSIFLPGMGQVYNGQVIKGIVIFLTSWLVIPWIYGIVDAVTTAQKINRSELDVEPSVLTLAGCLGLIILLLVGPFIAVKTLRTTVLSWLYHQENQQAQRVLMAVSRAAEAFAKDHGAYPQNYSQLYFAPHPYLDQLYCDVMLNDYVYSCSFTPEGYTLKAVPAGEKSSARKTYTVTTGGQFSSGQQ